MENHWKPLGNHGFRKLDPWGTWVQSSGTTWRLVDSRHSHKWRLWSVSLIPSASYMPWDALIRTYTYIAPTPRLHSSDVFPRKVCCGAKILLRWYFQKLFIFITGVHYCKPRSEHHEEGLPGGGAGNPSVTRQETTPSYILRSSTFSISIRTLRP